MANSVIPPILGEISGTLSPCANQMVVFGGAKAFEGALCWGERVTVCSAGALASPHFPACTEHGQVLAGRILLPDPERVSQSRAALEDIGSISPVTHKSLEMCPVCFFPWFYVFILCC